MNGRQPRPPTPTADREAAVSPKPRHVVFATDDGGFLPLMVAVRSLLASADATRPLRVSVLTGCGALTPDHEAALARQAAAFPFARVDVVNCDGLMSRHQDDFGGGKAWGRMIWARVLVAELFPDAHGNVVYLDIDTLVCRDLSDLYELDLSGMALAAVPETRRDACRGRDDIWDSGLMPPEANVYFNSGVLVLNLDAFRDENLRTRIVDWYRAHRERATRPDQDTLNALFWNRTAWLPARYNHCDGWLERQFKQSAGDAYWRGCPPREILEAILDPAILHFWGPRKPWKWNRRPEGRRYEAVLRATGLLKGSLPGTTAVRRAEGLLFRAYHGILRRVAAARLCRLVRLCARHRPRTPFPTRPGPGRASRQQEGRRLFPV